MTYHMNVIEFNDGTKIRVRKRDAITSTDMVDGWISLVDVISKTTYTFKCNDVKTIISYLRQNNN